MTPKHFKSYKGFTEYILTLALRDREDYLDSATPMYGMPDEDDQRWIDETNLEIKAIKGRLKKIRS